MIKLVFKFMMVSLLSFSFLACSKNSSRNQSRNKIKVDGSSTVYPISEAMAEEFTIQSKTSAVTVGISGTGGGFKKFIAGEIDINDASRKIKESEVKMAAGKGVKFMEIPVAYDGISIVVNPKSFLTGITVEQLQKIWKDDSVKTWKDVDPSWPEEEVKLYGPGTDSGTFDYFKEAIVGKGVGFRSEYTKSEDDNMLVKGVAGDIYSMGFFGYAYYEANKSQLKLIPVAEKTGSPMVLPSLDTIQKGTYSPLSRQVYIYLNQSSAKNKWVSEFVEFYLKTAMDEKLNVIRQVGYVALNKSEYQESLDRLKSFVQN